MTETTVVSIEGVHVPVLHCAACDTQVTLEPTQLRRGDPTRGEPEGWYTASWIGNVPGWTIIEINSKDSHGFKRFSFCPACGPSVSERVLAVWARK